MILCLRPHSEITSPQSKWTAIKSSDISLVAPTFAPKFSNKSNSNRLKLSTSSRRRRRSVQFSPLRKPSLPKLRWAPSRLYHGRKSRTQTGSRTSSLMIRGEARAFATRGTAGSKSATCQLPLTIRISHLMLTMTRWITIWAKPGAEPNSIYEGPVTSPFSEVRASSQNGTHLWISRPTI